MANTDAVAVLHILVAEHGRKKSKSVTGAAAQQEYQAKYEQALAALERLVVAAEAVNKQESDESLRELRDALAACGRGG